MPGFHQYWSLSSLLIMIDFSPLKPWIMTTTTETESNKTSEPKILLISFYASLFLSRFYITKIDNININNSHLNVKFFFTVVVVVVRFKMKNCLFVCLVDAWLFVWWWWFLEVIKSFHCLSSIRIFRCCCCCWKQYWNSIENNAEFSIQKYSMSESIVYTSGLMGVIFWSLKKFFPHLLSSSSSGLVSGVILIRK